MFSSKVIHIFDHYLYKIIFFNYTSATNKLLSLNGNPVYRQLRVHDGFIKTKISNSIYYFYKPNHYFAGGTILQGNFVYTQNDGYVHLILKY